MTDRSEVVRMRSAEAGNAGLDDRIPPRVGSEEIDASETGWEEGRPPSTDEIRLRAYYRYMERQGGDDDEIADWLAASPSCASGPMPAVPPSGEVGSHEHDGESIRDCHWRVVGRRQRRPSVLSPRFDDKSGRHSRGSHRRSWSTRRASALRCTR